MTASAKVQNRGRGAGGMSRGTTTWLAWSLCGLVLALIACTVGLVLANRYHLWRVDFLVAVASAALVGALVASRQPRNPVGWFILGHALCFSLGEFGRQYAIYGVLTEPGALPLAQVMIWPTYWIWYPGLTLMLSLLPLYFPNGRLVSRSWRWVTWFVVVFCTCATGLVMVRPGDNEAPGIPNPLGIESLSHFARTSSVLSIVLSAGWLLLGAVAAASLIVRFERSPLERRQQLKWFVYAVVLFLLVNSVKQLFPADVLSPAVGEFLFVLTLESLWIAIGVAVLRYRLYEIDTLINRTLVYGSLTATLALVYFGGVAATQTVFRALSGQEEQSQLAIVVSTLVIAALFNPLRRYIQGFIDRRFYRRKYDAARTLEAFSARLRDETDLDALCEDLTSAVKETMQPEHLSLWLRPSPGPDGTRDGEEPRLLAEG